MNSNSLSNSNNSKNLSNNVVRQNGEKSNSIIFIKKSIEREEGSDHHRNSVLIIENNQRKFSCTLKDDADFFNKNHITENLENIKRKANSIYEEDSMKSIESEFSNNSKSEFCKLKMDKILNNHDVIENINKPVPVNSLFIKNKSSFKADEFRSIEKRNEEKKIKYFSSLTERFTQQKNENLSNNQIININNKSKKIPNSNTEIEQTNDEQNKDAKYLLEKCIICDQYIVLKENSFVIQNCKHVLCLKCVKLFYEEQIEIGEVNMKCPVFKCQSAIDINKIKDFVSEKHYESLLLNIRHNEVNKFIKGDTHNDKKSSLTIVNNSPERVNNFIKPLKYNTEYNLNEINKQSDKDISFYSLKCLSKIEDFTTIPKNSNSNINIYRKSSALGNLKNFSKKHVLEICNDESFLLFNKFRCNFCPSCHEPALYGKMRSKLVKCLNCFQNFCKFCFKSTSADHFDLSANGYCKVYFRKRNINNIFPSNVKRGRIKNFLSNILLMVFCFIILLCFIYKGILRPFKSCTDFLMCKPSKYAFIIKRFFVLIFNMMTCAITVVIGVFTLPFFPALNVLVEYI